MQCIVKDMDILLKNKFDRCTNIKNYNTKTYGN